MAPLGMAPLAGDVWEVVGGAGSGGIIVRAGRERSSAEDAKRLGTGALVRVLERDAGRLRYEMISGEGPAGGWVSSSLKGRELLVRADVEALLECNGREDLPLKQQDFNWMEEESGEAEMLCSHCGLPIGHVAYNQEEQHVHAECMAQILVSRMRKEDEARRAKEAEAKRKDREEYDIGWRPERVPTSLGFAEKLEGFRAPEGMCCLAFDAQSRTVKVAATTVPAAAVNLEYLYLALQVRREEGREPMFSLDPLPEGARDELGRPLQAKRFEPAWLAKTSVGEVMFQADYHLKELSMGEHEQPVLGMRSCLDFCEAEGHESQWRAREWFVVNKAAVQLTQDGALLPVLEMGVEAREQCAGEHGIEDAKITRPDHPLVKYAEEFTRNFELIAERKSSVYHLRELAKASVLAKTIMDGGITSEESWFTTVLDREGLQGEQEAVPQLWNDRCYSRLLVKGGKLQDVRKVAGQMHGVSGGVHFGLDRLRLASVAVDKQPLNLQQRAWRSMYMPTEKAVRLPQGVDLSLGSFELSGPESVAQGLPELPVGADFWRSLADESSSVLAEKALFRRVFQAHMSDRQQEGEQFLPPGSSPSSLARLRELVKAEDEVQQRRRDHFFSTTFLASAPGPLFPSSWTESLDIQGAQADGGAQAGGALHPRPDLKESPALLKHMLRGASPSFAKTAEDGCAFRIYRLGTLELRSTQEANGEEELGVVFSLRPKELPGVRRRVLDEREKVVGAAVYVERALRQQQPGKTRGPFRSHFYVVFETEGGGRIVTEESAHGLVTLEENPEDLLDRNSLAKVFCSASCSTVGAGTTVRDIKVRQAKELRERAAAKAESRAFYCDAAFSWALQEPQPAPAPQRQSRGADPGLRLALSAGGLPAAAAARRPLHNAGRRKLGERNCFQNLF